MGTSPGWLLWFGALLGGMAMTESSDALSLVSMDGRTLPHSHAELVQTPRGWHVELDDAPR